MFTKYQSVNNVALVMLSVMQNIGIKLLRWNKQANIELYPAVVSKELLLSSKLVDIGVWERAPPPLKEKSP